MNPPHAVLRHAVASDLDAILALERATDNAPHWPPAAYAAILDSTAQPRCLIVAHTNASLTGFAVGLLQPADHLAELETVVVAANARRHGIGRALCNAVLDWSSSHGATELVLEVRATGAGAIALYAALGFTQTGRRPRYYRDPEDDAVAMRISLSDPA